MRQIALLLLPALLWACSKKSKEPDCRITGITYPGSTTKLPVVYPPGDTLAVVGGSDHGYNVYFNEQKRVVRREEPVLDNANYVYYKLPYYFSENLVTKQESTCSLSETRLFNYTFTSSGFIETMSDQMGAATGAMWAYDYECR
jgi:hypothetical protein